ncbi:MULTISPECIES: sigma-54 interaction domain-containing protein [unclassified Oceanobacillus]|uniref:sigma-54 interaction domain-containing protein n=1 Tax=unclassified Oceanobacillus TaxID=2630292 RepID=UPI00300DEAB0
MTFSLKLEELMDTNVSVLQSEKDRGKELLEKVRAVQPGKVVIEKDGTSYLAEFDEETGELLFLSCKKINAATADISKLLEEVEHVDRFLIYDGKRCKGFIDAPRLARKLFQSYQRMNAYLTTILETIDSSCTVIDANENVLIWTKGAEDIFSVKREEIIGRKITDFFHREQLELLRTLKDGTTLYRSQHNARENLVVLINSNPVYLQDKIIGAVVSEVDITSQIQLNNELANTTEKLFHLENTVKKLTATEEPFAEIKGNSTLLKNTKKMIKKAATTNTNVLIHGESGVGKELFAKAIHMLREGNDAPFIAINCGAIPSALFESEMFGYEKGAFSGADQRGKKGKVELAKGGTLFLDEIGEMPLDMQVKILRLLQDHKFFSVGGTKEKEVNFRVVAATNRDLKEEVRKGNFREDLYYRLNVVSIEVPPLRKRPEDIIELTHYFLYETSVKYNRPIHGISQGIMQALLKHEWPGNIRELKNVVERLVVFSESGEIKSEYLPFEPNNHAPYNDSPLKHSEGLSLKERLQFTERDIILKELKKAKGNKQTAAKNLQITRATLYNRMNKLGLEL